MDIAEDVETRFSTLSNELDRPLPRGWNKKLNEWTKDDSVGTKKV